MYIEELVIIIVIIVGIFLYRNYQGQNVGKYVTTQIQETYARYAPYSFQTVREKVKEMGQEYTVRQYFIQVAVLGGFAAIVSYLYFYSLVITLVYFVIAVMIVPYLSYLRSKRIYSEFIFEQIQVYTSNVIMEFSKGYSSLIKELDSNWYVLL